MRHTDDKHGIAVFLSPLYHTHMDNTHLVHRLSRIIGQLESLKNHINTNESADCIKTIQQLKASINGLKKFGEQYIKSHMSHCVKANTHSPDDMEKMLSDIISGTFGL